MITTLDDLKKHELRLANWTACVRASIALFRTYDPKRLEDGPALMFLRERIREAWRLRRHQQTEIRWWKKIQKVKIKVVVTFTESPSFNVRVLVGASTIFYNSERLQGNARLRLLGEILGITSLMVGEYDFEVSQDQYDRICKLGLE